MKTRAIMTLGLSTLAIAGAVAGVSTQLGASAFAGTPSEAKLAKIAAVDARKANKALVADKIGVAVQFAEAAVAAAPRDARYRALLGQVYLKAGRFASARDAFGDALLLSPNDGRVALNYALAQTASGDWSAARKTLDDHADVIPVADRGLATALAGDPASAVEMLITAVRTPGADAKTRQNLALSLALAGRWQEAKTVAAADIAPDQVDQRIIEWAAFAHPKTASEQVAKLLGVTPVQDGGQPIALALNAQVAAAPATAPMPVDAYMPGQPAPAQTAMADPAPVDTAPAVAEAEAPRPSVSVVFGERREVVQALPAQVEPHRAVRGPAIVMASVSTGPVKTASIAKGNYFVQIGAYQNAAVGRDGWARATRAYPALAAHNPSGVAVKTAAGSFYRVSVGGFARADADAMCLAYRAQGGRCFVRVGAGDQIASWVRPVRQLASR